MLKKFLEETVTAVEKNMGECYQVRTEHILKNNGVELDGILIMKEGENITPSIYLNDYYEEYRCGKTVETIASEVIEGYYHCMEKKESFAAKLNVSFEHFKDKIFLRLVNFKQNQKMMEGVPYITFLDLAVTFYCLVEKREEAIGTLQITNELMKEWNLEKEELFALAMENTPSLFPANICPMDEMIGEMLKQDMEELLAHYRSNGVSKEEVREAERYCENILERLRKSREIPIYVMSNTSGINGAAVLLYENVLKNFADSCQTDFYVLPSSIHEVLLVPCNGEFGEEQLRAMVSEVNKTQVPVEDILSDEVYVYHRKDNCFEWEGK